MQTQRPAETAGAKPRESCSWNCPEAWARAPREHGFLAPHAPLWVPPGTERAASLTRQFAAFRLIRTLTSGAFNLIGEAAQDLGFGLRRLPLIAFHTQWFQKRGQNDLEG